MAELNYQQAKKQAMTVIRAFVDVKVALMAALLVFLLYNGAYETIVKSSLEKFTTLDQASVAGRQEIEKKKNSLQNLSALEAQLKDLYIVIPELQPGQSPKVIAASESKRIADLATGTSPALGTFPASLPENTPAEVTPPSAEQEKAPPATAVNHREIVSLIAKGDTLVNAVDLLVQTGSIPNKEAVPSPINLLKFDYELKLKGSYSALADFLNKVVLSKTLIALNRVTISKPPPEAAGTAPKAVPLKGEKTEDQVPVEMTLLFSIYLYDPTAQTTPAPPSPPA